MASSPPILKYVVSPVSNSEPFGSAHKPHRLERTETLSVLSNTRITSQDHFQAVHHIELECSEPKFVCGDALGVYPPNSICAATEIAAHCNLQLTDRIKVESASQRTGLWIAPSPFLGTTMTVAELLTTYFDLESCASRTFLQTMKHFTHDEEELERLTELSSETRQEDYLAYCYREKRSAMEVLSEFPSCRVPFDFLVSNLKPLRPRYFSISSSPSADKKCIALTVARLEFATPYRRKRTGVCSSYLCAVAVDQKVECFVEKSPQPLPLHDCSRPLILVGPGTGIAPIRSVLREVATIGWKAPIHLFVGCRSPDKDFLYAAEWQGLKNRIGLHVHTAFSRMEGNKTYVQHRIVQADVAQPLSELLSCDPVIYVCGNSKQMPRDVETAITSVVQYYLLKGSEDGARQYIKQCKSEGRECQRWLDASLPILVVCKKGLQMPGPDEDRLSTVVLEAGTDAELEPVLQSAISFEGEAFGLSVRLPDELGAPAVRMLPMRGTSTLHHPPGSVPIAEALAKGEECIRIVERAVGDAVSLNVPGMIENMESVMASVNGGDSERKTKDDLDLLEGKLHQLAQLCRRQKLISLPIESVCEAANVIPLFEAVFPMIDQVNGTISALRSMEASTMALASVNGRNTSMMSSQEAATVYAKALSNRDAIRKASESTLAREKAIVAFVSQLTETTEVLQTLRAKCGHDED